MIKSFHIKIEEFEGPLGVLLKLIEKKKLDISKVSLVKITDQFLDFIKNQKKIPTIFLADFLEIASYLILLKISILMPYLEKEEEQEIELTKKLILYKYFQDAMKILRKRYNSKNILYQRNYKKILIDSDIKISKIKTTDLLRNFKRVLDKLDVLIKFDISEKLYRVSINLEYKINELLNKILHQKQIILNELLKNMKSKEEKVVTFLAALELLNSGKIIMHQSNYCDKIILKYEKI